MMPLEFTRVFAARDGLLVQRPDGSTVGVEMSWDALFTAADPLVAIAEACRSGVMSRLDLESCLPPPIGSQEVWAAGVTYLRSRDARMDEAEAAGGGDFYDRVYAAERPELFFKATPCRVVGHRQPIRVRADSQWTVPEPELTLAIHADRRIIGFTVGNDVSSRDIEGANPLYLPQAKVYDGSCALGPGLLLTSRLLPVETEIRLEIQRQGACAFHGATRLSAMKRTFDDLVEHLYRETSFSQGCYLMTGAGIVPPDDFSLRSGDIVHITIEPIGELVNTVA